MSKQTYEQLEQERNELAAQVGRLRDAALCGITVESAQAIEALKAQWQAEAINSAADFLHSRSIYISERYLRDFATQIIERAQECDK